MINDTTFRNYFLWFILIKFLSISKQEENKLNFTCQNWHYSNAPAAESWVSVAVNSHGWMVRRTRLEDEKSLKIGLDKLKNVPSFAIFYWFLFWLSTVIVAVVVLSFVHSFIQSLFDAMKWFEMWSFVKCEAIVAVDETFRSFNAHGFTSVDASDENSFTAFLRRAR